MTQEQGTTTIPANELPADDPNYVPKVLTDGDAAADLAGTPRPDNPSEGKASGVLGGGEAPGVLDEIEAELKKLEEEAEAEFWRLEEEAEAAMKKAKAAIVAVEEKVVGFFKTVFGHPLHDPTQGVTVSPTDATQAELTPWIQGQIDAGTIAKVGA